MSSDATDNTMRAEFEAWAALEQPDMTLHRAWGGYAYVPAAAAWQAWQAARAETARQVAEAVAAEREACAVLLEGESGGSIRRAMYEHAADAIRARSTPATGEKP